MSVCMAGMEVTTASAPVYDKTNTSRWKFLGVAAFDLTVCNLEKALLDKNPTMQVGFAAYTQVFVSFFLMVVWYGCLVFVVCLFVGAQGLCGKLILLGRRVVRCV